MGVLFRLWMNSWIPCLCKPNCKQCVLFASPFSPFVMLPRVSAHNATWALALGLPALRQCPSAVSWDLQVRQIAAIAIDKIPSNSEGHVFQCHRYAVQQFNQEQPDGQGQAADRRR